MLLREFITMGSEPIKAVESEVDLIARGILENHRDPVIRHILLKELVVSATRNERDEAYKAIDESINVIRLANEQLDDGGWGPFHSRSAKLKQAIPSTEVGVERAISLGLDSRHPILKNACDYIVEILEGRIPFPDYEERNDRWPIGKRLILCATLSLIDRNHPLLDGPRRLWAEIAGRTFSSGAYSEADEARAHRELTGASVKGSYLVLRSRYHLALLGSSRATLPHEIRSSWLDWLCSLEVGIGYLEVPLRAPPLSAYPGPLERWFASHELLSKHYPDEWSDRSGDSIDWLIKNRLSNGNWDFGSRAPTQHYFPLSESWKSKESREVDWTVRVLRLWRRTTGVMR